MVPKVGDGNPSFPVHPMFLIQNLDPVSDYEIYIPTSLDV